MTPETLFTDFKKLPGVAGMLDEDGVPLPAFAAELLGELGVYASEKGITL